MTLKKANDCVIDVSAGPAELVFDEFWRRGEVALMFGASGAGKSLLAMQAAEAIARGCDVAGFRLDAEPGRVLYVDLAMSDAQFGERYLMKGASGAYKSYRFSERLFRDRPPNVDALIPWLRGIVKANAIRYVVIDDLSSVMRTCDGTRETVRVMRLLKELRDELEISILVLMEAADPGRRKWVSEADLGRQAALCRIADSVFAIGRHWQQPEYRYLVQTRSRNRVPTWTAHNTFFGKVDMNLWPTPGFRFENEMDEATREIVEEVKRLRHAGTTFRGIAKQMGISKSRAARLFMRMLPVRWAEERRQAAESEALSEPSLVRDGSRQADVGGVVASLSAPGFADPPVTTGGSDRRVRQPATLDGEGNGSSTHACSDPPLTSGGSDMHGPAACPFLYDGTAGAERWFQWLVREYPDREDSAIMKDYSAGEAWCRPAGAVPPYDPEDPFKDMEFEVDDRGNERFVEERREDGKAMVWYNYNGTRLRRWKRNGSAIIGSEVNVNLFGRWADLSAQINCH